MAEIMKRLKSELYENILLEFSETKISLVRNLDFQL